MKRGTRPKGTCWLFLLFIMAYLLPWQSVSAQSLDEAVRHYQAGRLDEAKRLLLSHLETGGESPEVLFYLGMVEERGEWSREHLENLARLFPDWSRRGQADLLICKFELSRSMHLTAIDLAGRFERRFPLSQMVAEALWISGCSHLAADRSDSALVLFDRVVESFPGSGWSQWAQLGRGDCLLAAGKYDQAVVEYRKVLDAYRDSEVFAFALSGLIGCFTQLDDPESALLYHNLLKERYPHSPESAGSPSGKISSADEVEDKTRAERVAGVRYTIQLGVFAKRDNARRLRSRFEDQGYSVNLADKVISGKKYHVVRLGSFSSYDEASKVKRKLESQTGESYRIVIK
jgi:tetratricopeptide (TPR) repeat protein